MKKRPWTETDLAVLREHYGQEPAPDTARRLGRPVGQVYQAADRYGLAVPRPRVTPERLALIRSLNEQGLTDTEIAPRVGLCRSEVSRQRRFMKLPVAGETILRIKRAAVRTQRERLGIRDGGELRQLGFRNYAIENGWPADLRPREVQILNLLCAVGLPMTKQQLSEGISAHSDRIGCNGSPVLLAGGGNRGKGTYTSELVKRGLLTRLKRASQVLDRGRGKSLDLYCLGPAAIAILEQRAREESCQEVMETAATH